MQPVVLCITLLLSLISFSGNALSETDVTEELDAYWSEVARTVAEGDFEPYAAGYHPDAVLVSLSSAKSYPVSQALDRWQQGFIDTREGRTRATVEFKFSHRLHDETTAHEAGIFRYSSQSEGREEETLFVHFEALLIKKEHWQTLMEYQKSEATQDEWDALK